MIVIFENENEFRDFIKIDRRGVIDYSYIGDFRTVIERANLICTLNEDGSVKDFKNRWDKYNNVNDLINHLKQYCDDDEQFEDFEE